MVVGSAIVLLLAGVISAGFLGYRWYTGVLVSAYGDFEPISLRVAIAGTSCFVVGIILLIIGLRKAPPAPPPIVPQSSAEVRSTHSHVLWVYPDAHAINVPRNTQIVIRFDEPIDMRTLLVRVQPGQRSGALDPLSIHSEAILASGSHGTVVDFTVRFSERADIVVLRPSKDLGAQDHQTVYDLSIESRVKTLKGENAVAKGSNHHWRFTVGTKRDTDAPTIESIFPTATSSVDRNAIVQILFNKPMDPLALIDGNAWVIKEANATNDPQGERLISSDLRTVEFIPRDVCATNQCGEPVGCFNAKSHYTVRVEKQTAPSPPIIDLAGNALNVNSSLLTSDFTTIDHVTATPPTLARVSPRVNASGVLPTEPLTLTFDALLRRTTVTNDTVYIPGYASWIREQSFSQGDTQVGVEHDPWPENGVMNPVVTSHVQTVYQACFLPCNGP